MSAYPVAIVGIGCRFPGGVIDAQTFWQLLIDGRDAVGEVPPDRIDVAHYFDERPATPGRMMSRRGGFLDGIDTFDAAFFGISPREAERLDPQQRLLLETGWEALEDAGIDASRLDGSRTGVFVGQWLSEFESRLFADPDKIDFLMTTGSGRYAASGRLSYALGLRGPSLTIDTACSSSLVAVHLAVRALRSGECMLALAGGANVILQPYITLAYSQSRMMAPDGRCKFGDAAGDGYVRSEGAGIVVLKRLVDALSDGDRIYAVIRGSAVNNDGHSSGVLGRPSRIGHEELLRQAYTDAGVEPGHVCYVEAHGTGTRAGDPVEVAALGAVLGDGRTGAAPCLIGSVKTNIGHTESAAGVAGLIKAALALHKGAIPASLHFVEPNPLVPWAELPFRVPTALAQWPLNEGPRIAGVNSFGISGTNAHVVLQAAPAAAPRAAGLELPARPALLVLSARSTQALRALAQRHADRLTGMSRREVDDLCWSAATRRAALEHRAAFVADDAAGLVAQLSAFVGGEPAGAEGIASESASTAPVFVVPGQGGQWVGMARTLLRHEPAFRAALVACDAASRPWLDVSIVEQLGVEPSAPEYRLDHIEVIQPTLIALAIGYARWLQTFGVIPRALVGHSMGEVGAAHLAGVLDLQQAMRIVCRRSALMGRTRGAGGMAMVGLAMADAQRRLVGRERQLAVAASNAPASCVVSGAAPALAAWLQELQAEGIFCRAVQVDVASHSPQMDAPAAALTHELTGLVPHEAALPILSTVFGRRAEGREFDASYWGRNLRQPVRFDSAVMALLDEGVRCFVELGPHPVLAGSVLQTAQHRSVAVASIACGERDEPDSRAAMKLIAGLWSTGVAIDWGALLPRAHTHVDLPHYPWQRERHWCEAATQMAGSVSAGPARRHHPLLGRRFDPAGQEAVCWETTLAPARSAYLADHVVRGSMLFPAAAYLEAALAAAQASRPGLRWSLRDVAFASAWALVPQAPARLQLRLDWMSPESGRFEVHGVVSVEGPERWERRAGGRIVLASEPVAPAAFARCGQAHPTELEENYALLADAGLAYGPAYRGLRALRVDGLSAEATVQLDAAAFDADVSRFQAYPPLLDNVLQAIAATLLIASPDEGTPIPTGVRHFELEAPLLADGVLTIALRADHGDADIFDAQANRLGVLRGLAFTRLRPAQAHTLDGLLSAPVWTPASIHPSAAVVGPIVLIAQAEATVQPLHAALAAAGLPAIWCPAHDLDTQQAAQRLRDALRSTPPTRAQVVHLAALECPAARDGSAWIEESWQRIGDDTLALARALSTIEHTPPRVWLVTQGAVSANSRDGAPALGAAALWGLGRVWAHEQPALDLTLVDVGAGDSVAALPALLRSQPAERQLALRNGTWQVLRLRALADETDLEVGACATAFEAALATPGAPDSLHWRAAARHAPRAHEVEIEVEHAGLNFMNLMSALGVYPGYAHGQGPLGIEAAGRVLRVGSGVVHVQPGDAVVAVGHTLMQRHAVVDGHLVAQRPPSLDAAAAAGLPIAFLTAAHGLLQLARLERGERVLIHSAAGGVGLAALQVAHRVGAEVIATAGTETKRALLRSMGVQHVFDSRHTGFADAVLAATSGRGVDVVLNSLSGEALVAGLRCLAPYGRFVELGKRDIHGGGSIELAPFRAGLSFFAVDLDRMMRERPELIGRLLREVMRDVAAGVYTALPVTKFAADELAGAFRALMPGTHVGKHVVALQPGPTQVRAAAGLSARVHADGCYVVSGGLGALGLEIARWLAWRGAGAVMLIGRRAPAADVQAQLRDMQCTGTRVLTAACDVSDPVALADALARARRDGGPLRGVFHAAGVLADATLGAMTAETLRAPRHAKVLGAWHLHRLTQDDALEAFVMFSSIASLFGTPGQGNYAAANAFLDALAHHRHADGRPALALNLGPIAGVGLAAASTRGGQALRRLGFDGLPAARVIEAIDQLLAAGVPQAVCAAFDSQRWHAAMDHEQTVSLLEPAGSGPAPDAPRGLRDALGALPPGPPRRALMEATIKDAVGAVLRLTPARVPTHRALKSLGMDSLMALELRNRLEQRSGVVLSPTLAWNHPTVHALSEHLALQLQVALDAAPAQPQATGTAATTTADLDALLDDLDQLSDEQARALLEREGGA